MRGASTAMGRSVRQATQHRDSIGQDDEATTASLSMVMPSFPFFLVMGLPLVLTSSEDKGGTHQETHEQQVRGTSRVLQLHTSSSLFPPPAYAPIERPAITRQKESSIGVIDRHGRGVALIRHIASLEKCTEIPWLIVIP